MADTTEFFKDFLPNKIKDDESLQKIGKVFQFNIGDDVWTLDLANANVSEGAAAEKADCTITCDKDNWEKLLDNPALGMQLFMMGKLKADNIGLATQLQKILG